MRKIVFALLLVAVLLSLFAGVAFATCPEYEDKAPPGASYSNPNGNAATTCVHTPSQSGGKHKALPCP